MVVSLINTGIATDGAQQVNSHVVEGTLHTPDHIYLDLSLFKDMTIGGLIASLDGLDEAEQAIKYQLILDGLRDYQLRKYQEISLYMPYFGMTDTELEKRLLEVDQADKILAMSPSTQFVHTFASQMKINLNHSEIVGKYKKVKISADRYFKDYDAVTVYVNTYPLDVSKVWIDKVAQFFTQTYHVNTVVFCRDPKTMTVETLLFFQDIYMGNLAGFLDNTAFNDALGAGTFKNTHIFAPLIFDRNRKSDSIANFEKIVDLLKAAMDILCQFHWIATPHLALNLELFNPV